MRDDDHRRSWWRTLLDAQRRAGFSGLAGSEGSVQLVLSDALLNELIAARLPAAWPVKELTLHALAGDEVAVRARPRTAWLPPVQVRMAIEEQPAMPVVPLLRARFTSSMGGLVGVALGSASMPNWIRVSGDYVTVDVEALAAHFGMTDFLPALRMLTVRAEAGQVIVTAAFAVPPAR